MESIQTLLNEVSKYREDSIKNYFIKGKRFNVFSVANFERDEVKCCKILRELLDPNGLHGQGDFFLKLFVEDVLKIDERFDKYNYQNASVYREYQIRDGRIDLVICIRKKNNSYIIPIEVKIYAEDQKSQCYNYCQWLKNISSAGGYKLYYLTLNGSQPNEVSLKNSNENESIQIYGLKDENVNCNRNNVGIILLSFRENIISWLENCLTKKQLEYKVSIHEVLKQFIQWLKFITNQLEDKKMQKILTDSKDNFYSAVEIANNIEDITRSIMKDFFKDLNNSFNDKFNFKYLDSNTNEYDYNRPANPKFPGLSYYVTNLQEGFELWFRMEFDYHKNGSLMIGFVITKDKKMYKNYNKKKKVIKNSLGLNIEDYKDMASSGWCILNSSLQNEPSPRYLSEPRTYENFFDLLDNEKKKDFINRILEIACSLIDDNIK